MIHEMRYADATFHPQPLPYARCKPAMAPMKANWTAGKRLMRIVRTALAKVAMPMGSRSLTDGRESASDTDATLGVGRRLQ